MSLYFRGDQIRGSGLNVEVSVRHRTGADPTPFKVSSPDRYLDYLKWHKVAVRLQEGERVIRIYIDNMANPALVDMLPSIAAFPANAELRLAQEKSKGREGQIIIKDKFKVQCPKRRKFFVGKKTEVNCSMTRL